MLRYLQPEQEQARVLLRELLRVPGGLAGYHPGDAHLQGSTACTPLPCARLHQRANASGTNQGGTTRHAQVTYFCVPVPTCTLSHYQLVALSWESDSSFRVKSQKQDGPPLF